MAQEKNSSKVDPMQVALLNDPDFLRGIVENFCQRLLESEMQEHLQADLYERTKERCGYRNGYKPRKLKTRVVRIFPNEQACLRLISTLCIEQNEEWLTGKRYLKMDELYERENHILENGV